MAFALLLLILKQYLQSNCHSETLDKTNLQFWTIGDFVNLERCMPANGRFDGHIVQGHVDQTGLCDKVEDQNGSWKFWFSYDASKTI